MSKSLKQTAPESARTTSRSETKGVSTTPSAIKSRRPISLIVAVVLLAVGLVGAVSYIIIDKATNRGGVQHVSRAEAASQPLGVTPREEGGEKSPSDQGGAASGNWPSVRDGGEICSVQDGLCVTLPKGWRAQVTPRTYPNNPQEKPISINDHMRIDSKDETLQLHMQTGIQGIGGSCPSELAKDTMYVIKQRQVAIKKEYAPDGAPYAQAIIHRDAEAGLFRTYIGLSAEKMNVGEERKNCGMGLFGVAATRGVEFNQGGQTGRAGLTFLGTGEFGRAHDGTGFATYEQARAHLETPNMRQAFEIVASAHYK